MFKTSSMILGCVAMATAVTTSVVACPALDTAAVVGTPNCLSPLEGNWIEITDVVGSGGTDCGETYDETYIVDLATSCGGTAVCSFTIFGTGYSVGDKFKIITEDDGCLELCSCP